MRKHLSLIALILALCLVFSACAPWVPSPTLPNEPDDSDTQVEPDTSPEDADVENLYERFVSFYELHCKEHLFGVEGEQVLLDTIKNILTIHPEMFEEVMSCLAASEDPYSSFFTAEGYDEYINRKVYSGVGITVTFYEGYIECSYVNPDGPAAQAGLVKGDVIYSVDGKFAAKCSSDDLLALIRGEADTDVVISVYRPSDKRLHTYTVTRKSVQAPSVTWRFETHSSGKEYAVVTVTDFANINAFYQFVDFVNEALEKKLEDVIIDLRNNPGGDLATCLEMINICIPQAKRPIVTIVRKGNEVVDSYVTSGRGHEFDNLVLLVNGASISAAELFAIALQENGQCTIVGTQTFGKAVGQTHYTINDDGDMALLTSFELISPAGNHYHEVGVTPDVVAEDPALVVPIYELLPLEKDGIASVKYGEENDAVKALRQRLALIDLVSADSAKFDDSVTEALKQFQRMFSLKESGKLDDDTFEALTDFVSVFVCIGTMDDTQLSAAVKELLGE